MRVTAGTVADCTQAEALIDGIPFDAASAEYLLADRGYDTNRVLAVARERGITPVIPPKRNRKVAREYDAALYQARHLVENSFGKLKEWRGDALCEDCGGVPGDMPDTGFSHLGQANMTTPPKENAYAPNPVKRRQAAARPT